MDTNRDTKVVCGKALATDLIISKYDAINVNTCDSIEFEIGKTKFVISKEDNEITINYMSSVDADVTFSCTRKEDFENFVTGMFN